MATMTATGTRVIRTQIGTFRATATSRGVASLDFVMPDEPSHRDESDPGCTRVLDQLEAQLERYAEGRRTPFTVPTDVGGSPWQRQVWEALRAITFGCTRTYGEVAAKLGKPGAARAVGLANGQNPVPIVIPCHRVIAAGGNLGGYSGGLENKRALLRHEGVEIVTNRVRITRG